MPKIQLIDLYKQIGNRLITKNLNLEIPAHKMTVIIGRSGEGKSLLLKQIIGLIAPTQGQILVDGANIVGAQPAVRKTALQQFGYVFQFAALLDSLTVYENIGITLLEQGMPNNQVLKIVKEKLALVHLHEDTLYKYPNELSGGMRKRVGLARTLVTNPQVILYDEPTSGLDPITTCVIHELMKELQTQFQVTTVVISHDLEIFKYADYVALLHDGAIQYFGDAKSIWQSDNPFVYQFIRGLTAGPIQTDNQQKQ